MSEQDFKALYEQEKRLREEADEREKRLREEADEREKRLREEAEREKRLREEADEAHRAAQAKIANRDRELALAEQMLEDKDRKLQDEQQRREHAELLTRPTTLTEYLELCHTYLFNSISVQTDKSLSTKGDGTTKPTGKTRPTKLRHWDTFIDTQKTTLERLLDAYPLCQPNVFENRAFLQTYGDRVATRLLACEPDIQNLEKETVETPVAKIICHLHSLDDVRDEFNLTTDGITFYSHINPLSDDAQEVVWRMEQQTLEPSTPLRDSATSTQPNSLSTTLKPDQICVYSITNGDNILRKLAFVVEYKPPHKVTLPILRLGFHNMDIADVINCQLLPNSNKEAEFRYHADRIAASIATQTFSYMIQGGVQFGYITTGEGFVFLHIPSNDPSTLYYHLAEPRTDVDAQIRDFRGTQSYLYRTAVSQITAFSLLALESAAGNQPPWSTKAVNSLMTWTVDPKAIWEQMPQSIRSSPPSSPYISETFIVGQLPPGSPKRLRPRDSSGRVCAPVVKSNPKDEPSDRSDGEQHRSITPTPRSHNKKNTTQSTRSKTAGSKSSQTKQPSRGERQTRPFCTQQCLRGLVKGWLLDFACPNISDHRGGKHGTTRHQLNHGTFLALLRQQLACTLDEDCQPLGLQGARGALFKVTLASHGYTVVAKGTVFAFVKDLQHESQVYQRLEPIQGFCIPVCLGNIDLANPYYYDMSVRIIHMILLSWAGDSLCDRGACRRDNPGLAEEVVRSIKAIHRAGVLHQDVRTPNICWNGEVGRVMVIDFERSEILQVQRPLALSPISRKRRPSPVWKLHRGGSTKGLGVSSDVRFGQEVLAARKAIL